MKKQLRTWYEEVIQPSLTQRFALGAASLALVVLIVTGMASWWLSSLQSEAASRALKKKEAEASASQVAATMGAIGHHMNDMANSSLLVSAIMDSKVEESYLHPYLSSVKSMNGLPFSILLTDSMGKEITSNEHRNFTQQDRKWMVEQLYKGKEDAVIQDGQSGLEVIAIELIYPPQSNQAEGALLLLLTYILQCGAVFVPHCKHDVVQARNFVRAEL
jgi:hypothetical protein